MELSSPTFGPDLYGATLHINAAICWNCNNGVSSTIDIETDEKDNFVGIAILQSDKHIYYHTEITPAVKQILENSPLIGHNLKGDMKWLMQWGVKLKPEQLFYDTCLASYVQNTTKDTHSLKDLAKEYLGMTWPTYKEMVGTGKKKQTLDKQEIGRVAAYCGMDCLATYRLREYFQKVLNPQQKRYLETIELPTARVLLEMELKGTKIDVRYVQHLDKEFGIKLEGTRTQIIRQWFEKFPNEELNVNSNLQIAKLLQAQGAELPRTQKGNLKVDKQTLEQWQHLPIVPLLLEYSKIEKLKTTYTEGLLEKEKDGQIYAKFNQITRDVKGTAVGISTGRLSSSDPNLQNIPARTEDGKSIRKAFIAEGTKVFIDADYSQIEPRLVAHFSKDPLFLRSFRDGHDIYTELVVGTGRNRDDGKTFMLALLYGAQPKKLASVFKCSEKEAEDIIKRIMSKLPGVTAWIARTKYEAHQKKGVWTLFKRWVPLPNINSDNKWERLHWERVAVNTVIQGSAAEIMKLGLIRLKEAGYVSNLTVHDEFLIEDEGLNTEEIESHASAIKYVLESVVKLDVPIIVEVGVGQSWAEAKR